MNRLLSTLAVALIAASLGLSSGCDWTSGGGVESLNSSRGAGININFSGVYHGEFSGGRAVNPTSAGNITRLVINQNGNRLDVVDNQGSKYEGTVGSPGAVANPDENGNYPSGVELVQAQINFSGHDNVSAREIEFVGVIHVVTVTDIQGTTTEDTTSVVDEQAVTTTSVVNDGTNTTTTITTTIGSPGDPFYSQTVTVIKKDNTTGKEISRTVTTTGTKSTSKKTEFSITEANSQYRLEGTWIEKPGVVGQVKARSSGTAGVITTTTTTPTPTPEG